jgi:PhnB protein
MAKVDPVPKGYPRVSPYLICSGASDAIDFYTRIFGAKERLRMGGPNGMVGHAELELGDSLIMLADEFPEMGARSPKTIGGSPVIVGVYVDNVDAVVDDAVKAGAKVVQPIEDRFYGDRSAQLEDPFGHLWTVATHIEDVSPDEMERRAAQMMGGG